MPPLDGEQESTPEKTTGGGASDRKLKIYELWIGAFGVGATLVFGVLSLFTR
ncbi:hypothetical protein ACFXKJ_34270 [Kitasatospora indigofera]